MPTETIEALMEAPTSHVNEEGERRRAVLHSYVNKDIFGNNRNSTSSSADVSSEAYGLASQVNKP